MTVARCTGPFGLSGPRGSLPDAQFLRRAPWIKPPQDADRVTSDLGASASQSVNLPSGIAAGDYLVMWVNAGDTPTTPTGWSVFQSATNIGASVVAGYYKLADGTEGATETVTLASSVALTAIVWCVKDASPTALPQFSTSASTNPPALGMGRVGKWLAIAVVTRVGGTSLPSDYENDVSVSITRGGSKVDEGPTIDPGSFGTDSNDRRAATLVFAPRGEV